MQNSNLEPGSTLADVGRLGLLTVVGREQDPEAGAVVRLAGALGELVLREAELPQRVRPLLSAAQADEVMRIAGTSAALPAEDLTLLRARLSRTIVAGSPAQRAALFRQVQRSADASMHTVDLHLLKLSFVAELAYVLAITEEEVVARLISADDSTAPVPGLALALGAPGPDGPAIPGMVAAGSFMVGAGGVLVGPPGVLTVDDAPSEVVAFVARPGRWFVHTGRNKLCLCHAVADDSAEQVRQGTISCNTGALAVVDAERLRDADVRDSVPHWHGTRDWGVNLDLGNGTYEVGTESGPKGVTTITLSATPNGPFIRWLKRRDEPLAVWPPGSVISFIALVLAWRALAGGRTFGLHLFLGAPVALIAVAISVEGWGRSLRVVVGAVAARRCLGVAAAITLAFAAALSIGHVALGQVGLGGLIGAYALWGLWKETEAGWALFRDRGA